jgi:hypothetical protein
MTLGELLSELRNNILRDNSHLVAGDKDELWSDETLLQYIKDAEKRFARRTLIIRDGTTPEVTQLRLRTGQTTYKLPASVISVLSARFDVNQFDMARSGHALVNQMHPPEFLSFDPTLPYQVPPGAPLAYYTDETLVYNRQQAVTLSVFPAPGADQNGKLVYMRVVRIPTCGYTLADLDKESEIPEDYQLDTLEWAAYRALRGFDSDAGDPITSETHRQAYETAIARAIMDMKRTTHADTGIRFGQNGFTWSS